MAPLSPPDPAPGPIRGLLVGILLSSGAFGWVVSTLPVQQIQPFLGVALGLTNLATFLLLVRRSRVPGPEQRGWRILTLSFLGVMASNGVLLFTPSPLTWISPAEFLFFTFQVGISALQTWALFSWPFRTEASRGRRIMNLLGGLLFAGSLFLLLWSTALGREWDHGQWPVFLRLAGLSARAATVGGAATYFLAEDPRRLRGPMAWLFAAAVAVVAIIVLGRPYLYDQNAVMQPSFLFGLALAGPLCFAAAAWLRLPVEVPEDQPRLRFPLVEGLLYLPFAAVGGLLIHAALGYRAHLVAPLVGFVAVCALLLARQFLLLREVRRANERLEERVLARTRALEELQGIALRTERLNSIGVLGAGLAHDLNNALTAVRASAELARMRIEDGEATCASDLDRILAAADQSATLTGQLMAFARQKEEPTGPMDLAEEVSNREGLLRMMLPRTLSLTLDLEPRPVPIRASRSRLEQILVNLVGNAKDALPSGGNITLKVRVEADPPRARLEMADTGEGMAPEVLARIFEPFFTTKAPGKGTGLGLASVKHLVDDAGGSIQVESRPGQGTRFVLRFPLLP